MPHNVPEDVSQKDIDEAMDTTPSGVVCPFCKVPLDYSFRFNRYYCPLCNRLMENEHHEP